MTSKEGAREGETEEAVPELDVRAVRRLAIARAGLMTPERTGLPRRAAGSGARARRGAQAVVERFGYLQLDSVSVVGARTHALVLLSRLDGLDPEVGETLLRPGQPLFEYWGHEACWLPMDLYPAMAFRREEFRTHPWWGPLLEDHPKIADEVVRRLDQEGPLRTQELTADDASSKGWWGHGTVKKVLSALWSAGDVAVTERRGFQRVFDLAERVIPGDVHGRELPRDEGVETLLLRALTGHGWAERGTLSATWRLKNMVQEVDDALERLREKGLVRRCALVAGRGKNRRRAEGWIRPRDLELAESLRGARPRRDTGLLLSPFDPLLWDRDRVATLFGFDQVLEIYKPAPQRRWGYYCLPILAGEHLVGRVDLKAHRKAGTLEVRSLHFEAEVPRASDRAAARTGLERLAGQLGLELVGVPDEVRQA